MSLIGVIYGGTLTQSVPCFQLHYKHKHKWQNLQSITNHNPIVTVIRELQKAQFTREPSTYDIQRD